MTFIPITIFSTPFLHMLQGIEKLGRFSKGKSRSGFFILECWQASLSIFHCPNPDMVSKNGHDSDFHLYSPLLLKKKVHIKKNSYNFQKETQVILLHSVILQVKKMMPREVMWFVQGHTPNCWQSQNRDPGILTPRPLIFLGHIIIVILYIAIIYLKSTLFCGQNIMIYCS